MNKIAKAWNSVAREMSSRLARIEHSVGYLAGQRAQLDPFKHEITATYQELQATKTADALKTKNVNYYANPFQYELDGCTLVRKYDHHNCRHPRYGGFWRSALASDTGTINCTDYAIADIALRYATKNEGEHHSIARERIFRDSKLLEPLLPPPGFNWKVGYAPPAGSHYHMVHRVQGTKFIECMFNDMPKPAENQKSYKHFLVMTTNHAMSLTLKIHNKGGNLIYSTSWYDPNMTYNHLKSVYKTPRDFSDHDMSELQPLNERHYYASHHTWCQQKSNYLMLMEAGPDFLQKMQENLKHPVSHAVEYTWNAEYPLGHVEMVSRWKKNRTCLKHFLFGC